MADKEESQKQLTEHTQKWLTEHTKDNSLTPEEFDRTVGFIVSFETELEAEAEEYREASDAMMSQLISSFGDKASPMDLTEDFVRAFDKQDAFTSTIGRMIAFLGLPIGVDEHDTRVSKIINLCKEANNVNQA